MIVTNICLPWPPSALSPNSRSHWAVLAKAKKEYRYACFITAKDQGVLPSKAGKLHLTIEFYPPSRRAFDLDNCLSRMKSGLDGLADALQVDDKHWSLTIKKADKIGGFVKINIGEL